MNNSKRNMTLNDKTRRLVVSAMMLAMSTVISVICGFIPFLNLPFGGGITIGSMLPIVVVSYMYGIGWGIFTGGIYSLIQMMIGHGTITAFFIPGSDSYTGILNAILICLFDYVLAYTSLGIGGIFRKGNFGKGKALGLGAIVSMSVCYLFHILSGVIFYGAWAEWFFTDTVIAGTAFADFVMNTFSGEGLIIVYSTVYNGCYMIPEIILTVLIAIPVSRIEYIKKT